MRQRVKTRWEIAAAIGFAIAMALIATMPFSVLSQVQQAQSDLATKFSPEIYAGLDTVAKEEAYQTLHQALGLSIEFFDIAIKGFIFFFCLTIIMALYIALLLWRRMKSDK